MLVLAAVATQLVVAGDLLIAQERSHPAVGFEMRKPVVAAQCRRRWTASASAAGSTALLWNRSSKRLSAATSFILRASALCESMRRWVAERCSGVSTSSSASSRTCIAREAVELGRLGVAHARAFAEVLRNLFLGERLDLPLLLPGVRATLRVRRHRQDCKNYDRKGCCELRYVGTCTYPFHRSMSGVAGGFAGLEFPAFGLGAGCARRAAFRPSIRTPACRAGAYQPGSL